MKIGTLLTAAIVSLSAVGGGLAVYVAVTKYQTMDKVSVATNILLGPATIEPKLRTELNEKYRRDTDGALAKMNHIRTTLPGSLDDSTALGNGIDALNAQFAALRTSIDKALDGPAEPRKDAARKIVADNAVFNTAVTKLLDDQVRKIAQLDGDAYRQASYANIAWTLRDVGGFNSSLHKNLVAAKRAATDAEKMDLSRSQGRNDQILMSLQDLRGNPATPANISAALAKMNDAYVDSFGKEMKLAKDGRFWAPHGPPRVSASSSRWLVSSPSWRQAPA